MITVDGPGSTPPVPEPCAVMLCSDVVEHHRSGLSPETICAALRRHAPEVRVFVVPDLCTRSSGLAATVRALGTGRVVVGCQHAWARRQRILGFLRDAGVNPAGAQVVPLLAGERARPHDVAEQCIARLRAALARVSRADITSPVSGTTVRPASARLSRRDLFGLGRVAVHPVTAWAADRCQGRGASRACLSACTRQALSVAGPRICVDASSCSGCGACVAACPSGAMSLSGASMAELEAAASTLVEDACRLELGVAVVCAAAAGGATLGGPWLALEVPSLEMVTVGWLLQMAAAGAMVTTLGCGDKACTSRGRDLVHLSAELVGQVAPELRRLVVRPGDIAAPPSGAPDGRDEQRRERPAPWVRLHEPEATVQAMSALTGQTVTGQTGDWRLESPLAPLGEIVVDTGRCSACGCCVLACPTSALSASERVAEGALALEFDPSACPGCGACVASCPERAVSLCRAIGSSCLTGGRHRIADVAKGDRCVQCGEPLGKGLVTSVVAAKLAASHPEVARRLREGGDYCAECLLQPQHRAGPGRMVQLLASSSSASSWARRPASAGSTPARAASQQEMGAAVRSDA